MTKATKATKARPAAKPAPITFTFAYRSAGRTDVGLGVHAPGCKDLNLERTRHAANIADHDLRVASVGELEELALADYNTDFEPGEGYGPEAVKVHNCAKALITGKPAEKAAAPKQRAKPASAPAAPPQAGTVDPAAECKRLRDEQGMPWWLIGKTLGLPGAGDSAITGKRGAHQARRLYATKNGGEVPRTQAPRNGGKKAAEKGPGATGTKAERKTALTIGEHVIPEDLPDEAIIAMVAGKAIEWGLNLADLSPGPDEWFNHEARVHPTDVIVDEEPAKDGSRTIRFREFHGYDSATHRPICGPTRTVRIRAIHTVRG